MRRGLLAAVVLLAVACRGPSLDVLRAGADADLREGRLDSALKRAEEGLARARARGDRRWQWVFQVVRAEALTQRREQLKDVSDSLDEGLRTEPQDEVFVRALMTRAYASCLEAKANGHEQEALAAAAPQFDQADRLAVALGAEDAPADIALRRGNCLVGARRFADAEAPFREALALARRRRLAFIESEAAGSMGMVRAHQAQWDDAADWLARALETAPAGAPPSLRIRHLGNLGWFSLELGDYRRALPLLEESDALAERHGLPGDRLIALTNVAEARLGLGDTAGARAALGGALALARAQSDSNTIAEILRHLALLALEDGQHDAAHVHTREALRIDGETRNQDGRLRDLLAEGRICADEGAFARAEEAYQTVLGQDGVQPRDEWEARGLLAQLYFRGGHVKAAEAQFRQAFALMERARAGLRKEESRIAFFAGLRRFQESYVDLLVQQGRVEEALVAAERSRARQLQERLGLDPLAPDRAPLRPRELARARGATILSFWVTRERTLLWVITPGHVRLCVLAGEKALAARVDVYQDAVLNGHDLLNEDLAAGRWLYETLLEPAVASIPHGGRVVVVPDGPLFRLNLETLVVPGARPHYWVEDAVVLTAPWAGSAGPRPPARHDRDLLLIGDPMPPNPDFPRLANAAGEMSAIAGLFDAGRVTSYARLDAEPGAYRAAHPERYAFVHFAAHAAANEESPLDSAIVLSARDDRYKLYAREIMDVPLHAEVVSLSACRGAGSRAYAGEGLVGLAWAFLAAGAHTVLAGIWDVEDASASEAMQRLYAEMARGHAPAEALRAAKLGMLNSGTVYRKPVYWGPFALYAGAR